MDGRSFRLTPLAVLQVVGEDAHLDLVRKDGAYADLGVARRACLVPKGRY